MALLWIIVCCAFWRGSLGILNAILRVTSSSLPSDGKMHTDIHINPVQGERLQLPVWVKISMLLDIRLGNCFPLMESSLYKLLFLFR